MSGKILAFCCEHSAYAAADEAGRLRLHYPENVRIIKVPCAGRVDVIHILKAFENGVEAVLLLGCKPDACHHIDGNERAAAKVDYASALLKEIGLDDKKVAIFYTAPNAPHELALILNDFSKALKEQVAK